MVKIGTLAICFTFSWHSLLILSFPKLFQQVVKHVLFQYCRGSLFFCLVVSVELAQSEYTVVEGEGFVIVCAVVTQPIERSAVVYLATDAISARGW